MTVQSFADQPTGVKLGVAAALYNSFVLIEELIIDRHGLAEFLPCYRIGNFCIYDGLMLVAIGLVVFVLPQRHVKRCPGEDGPVSGTTSISVDGFS